MSFFSKNRIRNWLLIFLLVTNVATIGTILYHKWKFKQMVSKTDTHRRMKEFINNELKLTSDQKTKLETTKKDLEKKKDKLYDDLEIYRINAYTEFSKTNPNSAVIDSIATQTGITFAEINKASIMQYSSLFDICDAAQKVKLNKFFKDLANDISDEMKKDKKEKHDDD